MSSANLGIGLENIIGNITVKEGPEKSRILEKIKKYFTGISNYIKGFLPTSNIKNSWEDVKEDLKAASLCIGLGALTILAYVGIVAATAYIVSSLPLDTYVNLVATSLGVTAGFKAAQYIYKETESTKKSTLAGVVTGIATSLSYLFFLYPYDPSYIVKKFVPKDQQFHTLLGMYFLITLTQAILKKREKEDY